MTWPRLLRTVSFRLAALYLLLFTASAVVLGAVAFQAARTTLHQQMAARIDTETAFLADEFHTGGLDRLLAVVRSRERATDALEYLVQQGGKRLGGEIPASALMRPGWTTVIMSEPDENGGRPEPVRALVSDLGNGVLLGVGDSLTRMTEVEEAITSAFLWTIGVAALLGIGGGALLSRAFLSRVDAMARAAEAIIDGDIAHRLPVRGIDDDLDRLAGTLNRMLDRISTLMESLRQVSSDVAHDLRTPLSRLYQRLEDAQAHARSVPEYDTAVAAAVREAEGLLQTFAALLRIAQVEGASTRTGFRTVDLSAVAETVVDAYRPDAEAAGYHLTADVTPDLFVQGDQELLTQAIANLVENALRHTPMGTRINVRLLHGATGVVLLVEDDGPGVLAADLPRLTHRFYRGEPNRATPGNGLGLSLVAAVADLHRAVLTFQNTMPGLCVRLVFPAISVGRSQTSKAGAA